MSQTVFQTAFEHHKAGKLDQAEELYRQAIASDPTNSDAIQLLGVICMQKGRFGPGEALIREAISIHPEVPDYYRNLAEALVQTRQWNQAIASFRQLLAFEPANDAVFFRVGTMMAEHGQMISGMDALRRAIELRPENVDYHGTLSAMYVQIGRPDLAVVELREVVRLSPQSVRGWQSLGSALCETGKLDEGIQAIQKALQLNPNMPWAHCNLAAALREAGRHDEAMVAIRRAAKIDPASPGVQNNLATLLCDEGKFEEALAAWKLAVAHEPDSSSAHWNYARLLLRLGHFAEGWDEFEWRLKFPRMNLAQNFPQRQWDGSDPAGKTILLHAEGGFGDALQFIRLLPLVTNRGGRWLLECQPELLSLFEGTSGIEQIIARGQALPAFDMHIPLQGLPRILGIRLENIPNTVPYLAPPQHRVRKWAERIGDEKRLKVGLVWCGSTHGIGDKRTQSVQAFAPLATVEGIRFFGLQKGEKGGETPPNGMDWTDYTSELTDFSDTAALMQNLDLIISVDTSAAHLAGALGRPVWVLVPWEADFRWLTVRTDSPWYPTMRLFREPVDGDYHTPVAQIVEALREFK
jgi:Flp pilus assembly protein TadD